MTSTLYDVPGPRARVRSRWATGVAVAVLTTGMAWALVTLHRQGLFSADRWDVFRDPLTWEGLLRGLWATVRAAGTAALLAILLAFAIAAWRTRPQRAQQVAAAAWIEFFRGMPVVLLILFTLLVLRTSPFVAVVCGLALYNSAVIAEILRAGLSAVPRGQREAALALGLTPWASLRLVEFPQAVRTMLPALLSQVVVLLKDTSLGFIVSYPELLRQIRTLTEFFGNRYLFSVFFVGAGIYIALNTCLSQLAVRIERRTSRRVGRDRTPVGPVA